MQATSPSTTEVLVLNHAKIKAIGPGVRTEPGALMPLREALLAKHPTDAHVCMYTVPGSPIQYRLSNQSLKVIRMAEQDAEIRVLALDYDFHDDEGNKKAPSTDELRSFMSSMGKLAESDPSLGEHLSIYTTRHGLRVVYALSEPIRPEEVKPILRGILKAAEGVGLEFDNTIEWNRLFRLPQVARAGQRAQGEGVLLSFEDRSVSPADLPRHGEETTALVGGAAQATTGDAPDQETVQLLVGGRGSWTPLAEAVMRRLASHRKLVKGRIKHAMTPDEVVRRREIAANWETSYELCFGTAKLDGEENNVLSGSLGRVIGFLGDLRDEDPEAFGALDAEFAYALHYLPTLGWVRDPSKEAPLDALWRMASSYWANDQAQRQAARERDEKLQEAFGGQFSDQALDLVEEPEEVGQVEESPLVRRVNSMVEGFAGWARGRGLPDHIQTPQEILRFIVEEQLLLVGPSPANYYYMGADGHYVGPMVYDPTELLRRSGLPLQLTKAKAVPGGGTIEVPLNPKETFDTYGTVTTGKLLEAEGYYPEAHGKFLARLPGAGEEAYKQPVLSSTYRLNEDLTPAYHADVHEWYLQLCGGDEEKRAQLYKWIAAALDFSKPCVALALIGTAGSGKSMFSQALIECLEEPKSVGPETLVGTFQSPDFGQTPFVVIDEGISHKDARDLSVRLRQAVSGTGMTKNVKYGAQTEVRVPHRVVFAQNSVGALATLAAGGEDREDMRAMAERLVFFRASECATRWLNEKGNWAFTQGWAKSPRGESRYVIARHNLWVAQEFADEIAESTDRFAGFDFSGRDMLDSLVTADDDASDVLYGIADLCAGADQGAFSRWPHQVIVHDGFVYLHGGKLVESCREHFKMRPQETGRQMRLLFDGVERLPYRPSSLGVEGSGARTRYWNVPVAALVKRFNEAGLDLPKVLDVEEDPS